MAPKKETPDAPKVKKVCSPETLERLAAMRVKAAAVRQAMKEGRETDQLNVLQAKMDKLKSKKQPPVAEEPPEPIAEPTAEPTSVPVPDEESVPDKDDKVAKVEPDVAAVPKPETEHQAGPPLEKLKKKKKKPVVIVQHSSSDSDSDDSNVIYIKKSSRKKKESIPVVQSRAPSPVYRPPPNPFFNFHSGLAQRNFM